MGADKIVVVHNGALGDFLTLWPVFLSLSRGFKGRPVAWCGRGSYYSWLEPLGIEPPSPDIRRGVQDLYSLAPGGEFPAGLDGALILWFGLGRPPFDPGLIDPKRLVFVRTVVPGRFVPPAEIAFEGLAGLGLRRADDALGEFRRLFAREEGRDANQAVIFPGAGHRAKMWPLEKFVELAGMLERDGLRLKFLIGPAEAEKGMGAEIEKLWGRPALTTWDFQALSDILNSSGLAVGNDSGPMHLAGMLGLKGAVIFGPSSIRQWAPPGLEPVALDLPCRPCTQTTADINCPRPNCLHALSVAKVKGKVKGASGGRGE